MSGFSDMGGVFHEPSLLPIVQNAQLPKAGSGAPHSHLHSLPPLLPRLVQFPYSAERGDRQSEEIFRSLRWGRAGQVYAFFHACGTCLLSTQRRDALSHLQLLPGQSERPL
jgi:hypothetical protein